MGGGEAWPSTEAAVAPLVGEERLGQRHHGVGVVVVSDTGHVAQVDRSLPREVEAVGVDDRHDHRADLVDQSGGARVLAVVQGQVEGELHRVLARGPLARVVHAHLDVDRLAVALVADVVGDLDALHLATLVGLVGQRDRARQVRVVAGELLERVLVLPQVAVCVDAARQRRLARGGRKGDVLARVLAVAGGQVGNLDVVVETRLAQDVGVLVAVEHDVDEAGPAVLGHVEVEQVEQVLVEGRGCLDADELRALSVVPVGIAAKVTFSDAVPVEPERRQACTVSVPAWRTKPDATSTPLTPAEAATVRPVESKTARSQSPAAAFSCAPTMPLMGAATWRETTPLPEPSGRSKHWRYEEDPAATVVESRSCAPAAGASARSAAKARIDNERKPGMG